MDAHRGSYVEFFNHHASEMAAKGWIAEAARMRKDDEGNLVPVIAEGARPYAGTRVDLVDPQTGQAGLVGEQPIVLLGFGGIPGKRQLRCTVADDQRNNLF